MGILLSGPEIKRPRSVANLSKQSSVNLSPINLNAGGFSSSLNNNTLSLRSSGQRQGLVSNLAGTSLEQADLLAGLRGQVGDATEGLRASRLREVENRRRSSISNLRDNLARRRVLGSSFGQDAETRANLEFAQESDRVEAESFLQELELNNQLINQEFDVRRNAFATQLDELNLQADFAAGLSSQASNLLQASAQLKAQLAAQQAGIDANIATSQANLDTQAAAGTGSFLGKLAGIGLAPLTGGSSLALAF